MDSTGFPERSAIFAGFAAVRAGIARLKIGGLQDGIFMNQTDEWLREASNCLKFACAARDSNARDEWVELANQWIKLALALQDEEVSVPGKNN